MSRAQVRSIKRGMRQAAQARQPQQAAELAGQLLQRSIMLGHRRLAVIRLHEAARLGAPITPDQLAYCERAARASGDARLLALFRAATTAG